jgi:hypothetical protein
VFGLNWSVVCWGLLLFVLLFVVSLLIVGALLVGIPPTFFLDRHARGFWIDRHPVLRLAGAVVKNILGVGLILLGVALSLPGIPGQGLLTILIGLALVDFPGKRRGERWLLRRGAVLEKINRLRARFGQPPLVLED